MSYTERFDRLYEDLRLEVRNKVKELGKSINIKGRVDIVAGKVLIVAVGEDVLYDEWGYECSYSEMDIEDFCTLADYVKTL